MALKSDGGQECDEDLSLPSPITVETGYKDAFLSQRKMTLYANLYYNTKIEQHLGLKWLLSDYFTT